MVILSLSLSLDFLFFLATLLYIDELLWFLKLYLGIIHFGVVFFSSPLQLEYLSLIVLIWFLFELILNYFGSKNLSLYQNTILTMLITARHLVHFIQFGPIRSTLVQLGPLIYFGQFSLLWSIQSCSVHSVQFSSFGLLQSI